MGERWYLELHAADGATKLVEWQGTPPSTYRAPLVRSKATVYVPTTEPVYPAESVRTYVRYRQLTPRLMMYREDV